MGRLGALGRAEVERRPTMTTTREMVAEYTRRYPGEVARHIETAACEGSSLSKRAASSGAALSMCLATSPG